ncbi:MAG TPA: hypothetical protein VHP11_08575 [Tepidisphaeraceae bacterium]|nr:hypothetical protein [Tepidisphaeraceae bacterium]
MRRDALVNPRFWLWLLPLVLFLTTVVQAQSGTAPTPATPPSSASSANSTTSARSSGESGSLSSMQLPDLSRRENFSAAMQIIILLTVLSLAPAILIMMTSFTRIVIVLSLLRQAMGTASLPPNQVLITLALFMTFLIMGPTLQRVNGEALQPYMEGRISQKDALNRVQVPLREFMISQIERGGNREDVLQFTENAQRQLPG